MTKHRVKIDERVVTMRGIYNEKEDHFFFEATCPVCHKVNRSTDRCEHFLREEHGCGGDVAIFKIEG